MSRATSKSGMWRGRGGVTGLMVGLALVGPALAAASEFGEPILLRPLDPAVDRSFGAAVAIDGNTLAIGAPGSPEGGVVYVYQRQASAVEPWRLQAMLTGINPGTSEQFGAALALEGDTLVVGAPHEASRGNVAGAAYVFYRDRGGPGRWGRVRVLAPKGLREDSYYGTSVAISGSRLAVGGWGAHRVWVHERNRPIRNWWGVQAELEGELTSKVVMDFFGDEGTASGFGKAVALSGNTLAVSAVEYDRKYGFALISSYSYGAFLFDFEATAQAWRQTRHHAPPALASHARRDFFGSSMAMDGDVLLAGNAVAFQTGSHVFERNFGGQGRWSRRQELRDARGEFGSTDNVAIRGNTVAIAGKFSTDVEPYPDIEGALVYQRHRPTRNQWGVVARLFHPDIVDSPWSIAVGPGEVVIGHGYPGVVQIYTRRALVADDFEAGEISGFSRFAGNLEVVSPGLDDTGHAVAVRVDGTRKATVLRARQPEREPIVSLGFDLAVNQVDLADSQVEIMNFYGPTRNLVRLILEADPVRDQYWITLWAWDEARGWREAGRARMPPRRGVRLDLEWRAAKGPGTRDGLVRLSIDGRTGPRARDLDTDRQFVKGMLLGLPKGSLGAVGGEFLLDEIVLHR